MDIAHPAKVIAFFLPQMHPVAENDAWWGRGFTEWTKVVTAEPLGPGHYQPHLPGELGFYDLRVPEIRERQAELARRHGVHGFMYYHYWFGGERLIDRPVLEMLRSGRPDFPFCLCWANENWTRAWDAGEKSILMEQRYDEQERDAHIDFLISAFSDRRYIHHDGRPVFVVYRAQLLTERDGFVRELRRRCAHAGLADPYLIKFDTQSDYSNPADIGFDAAAQFHPHGILHWVPAAPTPPGWVPNHLYVNYEDVATAFIDAPTPPWIRHECVVPSWDNTARRRKEGAIVLLGATPERYERWLRAVYERAPERGGLVFINAWNEWAEGAHLEPDAAWGDAALRATARVVLGAEPEQHSEMSWADPGDLPVGSTFEDLYLDVHERYVSARRRLTSFDDAVRREAARQTRPLREQLDAERRRADQLAEALAAALARDGVSRQ